MENIISQTAGNLTGETILKVLLLPGGFNSEIYKIKTKEGNTFIAKRYKILTWDRLDRLEREYSGLSFLWKYAIREIPRPIFMDKRNHIGVYSYIPGRKILKFSISTSDTDKAADFLASIHALTEKADAKKQPNAKEACFSITAYIKNIEKRLQHLESFRTNTKLQRFLTGEFYGFWQTVKDYVLLVCKSGAIDLTREIPLSARTLSPTDFCFRNALRWKNMLYFLDFEYWGWDDPVKVVANFFLHPAVPLPIRLRLPFYEKVRPVYIQDRTFSRRLPLVFLLMGLKWCLIMLNPFLENNKSKTKQLGIQLIKARNMLVKTKREYEERVFPVSL